VRPRASGSGLGLHLTVLLGLGSIESAPLNAAHCTHRAASVDRLPAGQNRAVLVQRGVAGVAAACATCNSLRPKKPRKPRKAGNSAFRLAVLQGVAGVSVPQMQQRRYGRLI
jgi:hypothetical protein